MGKFVVIYGANNLGKSTQVNLLEEKLTQLEIPTHRLKYPIYDLEPTGPLINSVLREGVEMSDLDLQIHFAQNRRDFEPTLQAILDSGTWVVAEDYTGTGIAWATAHGIPLETMEEMNADLKREDIAIVLDGDRITTGIEKGHRHEAGDKWEEARKTHQMLAERYGWEIVNANGSKEQVHQAIMDRIYPHIS